MDELRLALRRLLQRPASALASIATLACAIAAAAVTWSTLSSVLLYPLPIPEADRLFVVGRQTTSRLGPSVYTGFDYPTYWRVRESGAFERTAAQWSTTHSLLVKAGDMPTRQDVAFVTYDYFDVVGVPIVRGRGFAVDDDRRGAPPVALLTHRYWRRSYGADPSAIGRTISISGKPVTIVGILDRRFRGLSLADKADLYLAFHTIADLGSPLTNYFADPSHQSSPTLGTMIVGRVGAGHEAEANARIAALEKERRGPLVSNALLVPAVINAVPAAARAGMDRFAQLLAATVGLLLVIGCTAVGMLLLIRTEARSAEFAMCLALGASRMRLVRGIVTEGALLAGTGSMMALPVAYWLFDLMRSFQLPGGVSIELLELSLDLRAVAVCVGAATLAVVLIASIAATFGFRADVADALRARSGATERISNRTARAALVGAQVAVSVVLLTGAGLFTRSLIGALSLNTGLDMSRVVIGTINLGPYGYSRERASQFFEELREKLKTDRAIDSIAFSGWEGGMSALGKIQVDGVARQFPTLVSYVRVDPQFFRTMGMRILEGRDFGAEDRDGAPATAIVSQSFARLISIERGPLGSRIEGFSSNDTPLQVVGVASDLITNVTVMEPLIIYMPTAQRPPSMSSDLTVLTATAADVADIKRRIVATMRALDPNVTPTTLRTLEERVASQMAPQQLGATVLGALGIIAVLLTLLGTYVLTDSMTTLRMREIGIRAALGATRRQLGSIVLSETARLIGSGLFAGLGLAWLGSSTIRAFLFQVEPLDPPTLGVVVLLIMTLALLVSLRAALRAARVDLVTVLKAE